MIRRRSDWRRGRRPNAGETFRVSVIICVVERAETLAAALEALNQAALQCPGVEFEFIVVDSGTSDETAALIGVMTSNSSFPVIALVEPRRGVAVARNAALLRASGDLLVFVGEDCELRSDYFRRLCDRYSADTELVVRGGRVEPADEKDLQVKLKLSSRTRRLDRETSPNGFILGCNMVIPRDVILELGCFDERFGFGAIFREGEATDYLVRRLDHGIVVEYVPDLVVRHRHGCRSREVAASLKADCAYASGALSLKHLRRAPSLMRQVRTSLGAGLRQATGGPAFSAELKISHWRITLAMLSGMAAYARVALLGNAKAGQTVPRADHDLACELGGAQRPAQRVAAHAGSAGGSAASGASWEQPARSTETRL